MRIFFWRTFLATPPKGTKLSLGKLGRATAVGNSDYTSKTSLNDAGRDSGTGKTSIGDFYIGSVDNTLDGYPYVDEQTNETYEITFTNSNTLFDTRIRTRHQNFTWTTADSDLFELQSNQDYTAQYNAGTISDATSYVSKSYQSNLFTDNDFNAWDDTNTLTSWYESGASVITRDSITTAPSSSNAYAVRFDTQDSYISQSFTVKGNSIYEIVAHSSASGEGALDMHISGAYYQRTWRGIQAAGSWQKTRDDFATSGSNANQTLMVKFTAVSASSGNKPLLDSVFFRRWEGSNFSDTEVTISGKYHDAGQSDGFNDHATRYNTAIQKTVEIQDTYGGLAIACFLPGTLIVMSDGDTKPIEEINVGDEVMSLDLPGLPDEDLGYLEWKSYTMRPMDNLPEMIERNKQTAKVENLFYDYMDGYYSINNGYLKVTSEHDLFVYHNGNWSWKTPTELNIGMKMFGYEGEIINIDSMERVEGEVEVVNFDVEPLDVYFAGGVLVHNKGTDSDPG
jgi:hypothetical protein